MKGGKLHLFAHFESNTGGGSALQSPATNTTPSFSRSNTEAPSRVLPSPTSAVGEARLPLSADQGSIGRNGLTVSMPRKQKRASAQDLSDSNSDSDSDDSGETQFLLSPSELGDPNDGEERNPTTIHQISSSATAAQHAIDFDSTLLSNAPKGQYGHKGKYAMCELHVR